MRKPNARKALYAIAALFAAVGVVGVLQAVVVFVATLFQVNTILSLIVAVLCLAVARKENPRITVVALATKMRGFFTA